MALSLKFKLERQMNDTFRIHLAEAFKEKFKVPIVTEFNFFADKISSTRLDGQDFTPDQFEYIQAYEAGYLACMRQVRE